MVIVDLFCNLLKSSSDQSELLFFIKYFTVSFSSGLVADLKNCSFAHYLRYQILFQAQSNEPD
ncbi:MAG: hypothetical protein EA360_06230 [Balneolaceae bacterium]|nr:MAG: hypothetical protein EA360_06230 [Balneolaceae bacterium]